MQSLEHFLDGRNSLQLYFLILDLQYESNHQMLQPKCYFATKPTLQGQSQELLILLPHVMKGPKLKKLNISFLEILPIKIRNPLQWDIFRFFPMASCF